MKGNRDRNSSIPSLTFEEEEFVEQLQIPDLGKVEPLKPASSKSSRLEQHPIAPTSQFAGSELEAPLDEELLTKEADEYLRRELPTTQPQRKQTANVFGGQESSHSTSEMDEERLLAEAEAFLQREFAVKDQSRRHASVGVPIDSLLKEGFIDEQALLEAAESLLLQELSKISSCKAFDLFDENESVVEPDGASFPARRRRGTRFLRLEETGNMKLSWWKHPGENVVLVFDPHGMTVRQIKNAFVFIQEIARGRIVYVIHGSDGTNPLGREVANTFQNISKVKGNPGVTRVDLR